MNGIDLFGGTTLSSNLTSSGPALATLAAEINAEHDAAENHARKAIEHARAAGEKLLLAKAGVAHGQWLPWLNSEIESGRLEIKSTQARVYMRVAANKQRAVHLEDAASIRAALELLSDQEPEEQQGTLIDVEPALGLA